jgi:single-stranded DNA-binding protein
MQRFIGDGNVVRITRGLQTFTGNNGQQVPQLFFTLAVKRNYQAGQGDNRDYPTDFIHCKVTGRNAEIFNQYCSQVDANGKLVSRHLMVEGEITQYKTIRKVDVPAFQINIGGQLYNVQPDPVEIPDTGTTLEVDRISFLDYKNGNVQNGQAQPAQGTIMPVATPVANSVAPVATMPQQVNVPQPVVQTAQPVAPVAQPAQPQVAAPVAQPTAQATQPVAQPVQPVAQKTQPVAQQVSMVMNAPTEAIGPAPF